MKKLILGLIAFSATSCIETLEIEVPPILGDPSSAILKSEVKKSGDTYTITVDVHVVNERGLFIKTLRERSFLLSDTTIYGNEIQFSLNKVESNFTPPKGSYSAMFLLDQSGSILSTDPDNLRIDASKVFINTLGENDEVGLSSFTTNLINSYKVHHNFMKDKGILFSSLDSLAYSANGGTPLYFSTYQILDYVQSNARNLNNKALIVFTDGADTQGRYYPKDIISKAQNLGVQVYTVGLGAYLPNLDVLWDVAQQTGGYFMWASDAKQLISYFGTLGNLLNGNAGYYRLSWNVTSSLNSLSGQTYVFYMNIKTSNQESIRVAIPVVFP